MKTEENKEENEYVENVNGFRKLCENFSLLFMILATVLSYFAVVGVLISIEPYYVDFTGRLVTSFLVIGTGIYFLLNYK